MVLLTFGPFVQFRYSFELFCAPPSFLKSKRVVTKIWSRLMLNYVALEATRNMAKRGQALKWPKRGLGSWVGLSCVIPNADFHLSPFGSRYVIFDPIWINVGRIVELNGTAIPFYSFSEIANRRSLGEWLQLLSTAVRREFGLPPAPIDGRSSIEICPPVSSRLPNNPKAWLLSWLALSWFRLKVTQRPLISRFGVIRFSLSNHAVWSVEFAVKFGWPVDWSWNLWWSNVMNHQFELNWCPQADL